MNEFENDPANDDHIVEITDLDPLEKRPRFSRMFEALERRPLLRKRFWRYATASCSVLLILLVLFSTFPSIRSVASGFLSRTAPDQSTTLITPTPTPIDSYGFIPNEEVVWALSSSSPFIPSATLGPAPRDCPVVAQTHPSPQAAANSPVLVIGFEGPDAILTNFKHAQPPEIGWYRRIFILTQTNYSGAVTFHGGDLSDGTPIWFGMGQHNQAPITTFTVLPLNSSISNHTGSDEEWGLSTATLYIPRADCYFLKATWPGGRWVIFFSAGR